MTYQSVSQFVSKGLLNVSEWFFTGSGKQLQCLLDMSNTVTTQCRNMLKQRQELWGHVSDSE